MPGVVAAFGAVRVEQHGARLAVHHVACGDCDACQSGMSLWCSDPRDHGEELLVVTNRHSAEDLLGRLLLLAAVGAAALREEEILLAVATDRRVEFGELLRLHHRGPVIVASSPRDPAAMSALAEVSATGRADAVASLGSARDAVRAVSRGGTVCLSGQPTEAPTVTELVQREVRLVGASDLPATLARVGRRDVESVLGAGARNRGSPRTQHHQGGPTGAQQERQEGVDMGRLADGTWAEEWIPPTFTVDRNGKVVGYVNDRTPNNWGRWGELDERGTVNLITPDKVVRAASLIRTGKVISCAIPLDSKGPVHPTRTGVVHMYGYTGSDFVAGTIAGDHYRGFQGTDDYIFMPLQGSTQWDGIAHFFYKDTMYNGFWIGNVEAYGGARRGSIHNMKDSLTGRGVLLDIPRVKGLDRLQPGYAITPDDLDAASQAHGVQVGEGDILLIRTGHVPYFYSLTDKSVFWDGRAPGIGKACVQWLADKDVAALAMDNIAIEVEPFEPPFEHVYPLHSRLIRDLGLTLGEVWWLEDLANACAEDGRYEFFIAAPPLNVTNASGAPLNPIVVK